MPSLQWYERTGTLPDPAVLDILVSYAAYDGTDIFSYDFGHGVFRPEITGDLGNGAEPVEVFLDIER